MQGCLAAELNASQVVPRQFCLGVPDMGNKMYHFSARLVSHLTLVFAFGCELLMVEICCMQADTQPHRVRSTGEALFRLKVVIAECMNGNLQSNLQITKSLRYE